MPGRAAFVGGVDGDVQASVTDRLLEDENRRGSPSSARITTLVS
jgi:hypothetical protein